MPTVLVLWLLAPASVAFLGFRVFRLRNKPNNSKTTHGTLCFSVSVSLLYDGPDRTAMRPLRNLPVFLPFSGISHASYIGA